METPEDTDDAVREYSTIDGWRLAAVSLLAATMLVPVTMPVAVLRGLVQERFDVTELQTSLFMSINMIGALLSAPLIGAIADRIRARKALIAGALLVDGVLFWCMTLPLTFPVFMTVRFLEGVAHIGALSSLLGLLADSAGRSGRVMGSAGAGITFGVAVGAPLGGFLGRSDPMVPLQVGSLLLIVVAVLVYLLLTEPLRRTVRPSLGEVLKIAAANRALVVPYIFSFVDRFTTGFFTTTFSLFMRRVFDLSPPSIGLLLAYFMAPFSLLAYPMGRLSERVSRTALMCGGSLLYGVGTASLGWWSPDSLPYLMFGLGVLAAVMFVPSLVMTVDLSGEGTRATALGGFNAAGALGFIAGPLIGGWISQAVAQVDSWESGYRAAFVVAGSSEVVCVLALLPLLLRLRRQGRTT